MASRAVGLPDAWSKPTRLVSVLLAGVFVTLAARQLATQNR
jgi:hypothetical protein